MNLIILLDNKGRNVDIKKDDIVITNNVSLIFDNNRCFYVSDRDVWNDPKPKHLTKSFFSILPKEFHVFENSIYGRLLIPLYAIINVIDEVLSKNDVDAIYLYGGNNSIIYSPYKSESEGDKWLYRTSWFVNPIINKLYNEKIKIKWNNKSRCINFLFFFREAVLLTRLLAKAIVYSITYLLRQNIQSVPIDTDCICVTYMPLQYEKLHKIITVTKYKKVEFITSYRSCSSRRKGFIHHKYFKIFLFDFIFYYRDFYKKINPLHTNINLLINEKSLNISKSLIKRIFLILYIEFYGELRNIERFVKNVKKADILTCFTYGLDIIMVREICRIQKRKHYNFQVVSMSKMDYPDIELADRYFLLNDEITAYYKSRSLSYSQYLPPYVNVSKKDNSNKLKIGLFLQPDSFADRYYDICKNLINRICYLDVKLVIKPHYRQNQLIRFEKLKNKSNISILSKNMSIEDAMDFVDIAISISSSILFDAFLKGVMGIAILEDEAEREIVKSSNIVLNEVNYIVKSMDELINILLDYDSYLNAYINRRQKWLDKHSDIMITNIQL